METRRAGRPSFASSATSRGRARARAAASRCGGAARAARARRRRDPLDRRRGLRHREAELRVGLAGRDLLVRLAAHVRRDADQHRPGALRRGPLGSQPLEAVDVVEVVDHDQADAGARAPSAARRSDWALPCMHDPLGSKAGAQREVQLAGGGDVTPEALLREQRHHGGAGKRLRGEDDLEVVVAGPRAGLDERARARAQVILGDDVGGRAELARQLDHVAAADLQAAALVEPAAERVDVREALSRWPFAAIIACGARPPSDGGSPTGGTFGRLSPRLRQSRRWRRNASSFGKDSGLQARMVLTMFLLGLVYVVLVGALIAAGASAVLIVVIAVVLFAFQMFASDKIALASARRARGLPRGGARAARRSIERLCVQADLPKPRVGVIETPDAERLRDGALAEVGDGLRDARHPEPARARRARGRDGARAHARDQPRRDGDDGGELLRDDRGVHHPLRLLLRRRLRRRAGGPRRQRGGETSSW